MTALRFGFLLAFTLLVACNRNFNLGDKTIAKIDGSSISVNEFLVKYNQLKSEQDEVSRSNPKVMEGVKLRALNETIVVHIIREEAKRRGLRIPKEEIEGRLASWKDGYPTGGFEEMLRRQNITEGILKLRIEEQFLIQKVIDEVFYTETLVSDEEMQSYHKTHEKEFYQPARVHAHQIVVPTVDEANKIRQEILAGKITFQSAARKYSLSPDAAKGGDIGFFSRNEKIPAFNNAFNLHVGDVSQPIKSRYGVHLLKVVEKQLRTKLTYEQAKADIAKRLKRIKQARVYKEWVTKLLKEGKIYRNEPLFQSIA
ncbi:MAG: peptidylprolyl isomerase [Bdellovibrionales bacterium]|nr:peptidylprolyl isomerase [Bdellovibrionales bacterium]